MRWNLFFVRLCYGLVDVADMGEPLDTNKELNTVGWSNIISGLTGGFTGRYDLLSFGILCCVSPRAFARCELFCFAVTSATQKSRLPLAEKWWVVVEERG